MRRSEEGWEEVRAGPLGDGQVHSPLALPGPLGHGVEGRVQAVGVVADVAVVAQQQAAGVAGLAARLAHRALQTAPPLGQDDPRDLGAESTVTTHSHTQCVTHNASPKQRAQPTGDGQSRQISHQALGSRLTHE